MPIGISFCGFFASCAAVDMVFKTDISEKDRLCRAQRDAVQPNVPMPIPTEGSNGIVQSCMASAAWRTE